MDDAFGDAGSTRKAQSRGRPPPVLQPEPAVASWLPSPPLGKIAFPAPFPTFRRSQMFSGCSHCKSSTPTDDWAQGATVCVGGRTGSPFGRLWPSLEPAQHPRPILANEIEFYEGLVSAEFFSFILSTMFYWVLTICQALKVLWWTRQEVASPS